LLNGMVNPGLEQKEWEQVVTELSEHFVLILATMFILLEISLHVMESPLVQLQDGDQRLKFF